MPAITRDDDRAMMLDSSRWPGQTLCLKKRERSEFRDENYGLLLKVDQPVVIYLRPHFVKTVTYPNVDAALDDGWVVD